jgi:hypothetical protein
VNIILSEIERRHAARKGISKQAQQVLPPVISDNSSIKEHKDQINELQTMYQAACFLVETDVDALLYVINQLLPDVATREEKFKEIASVVTMDKYVAARLATHADKGKEKRKEIDGQLQVGDEVTPKGKVKKGAIAKLVEPAADLLQEAKETVA